MIRNYIIIAWRSLLKNKLFSFINVFGLALSMSVCMMVIVRIIDNFSYDRFHPAVDRTYRILSGITNEKGDSWTLASTPLPLREAIGEDPSIEEITSLYPSIHENGTDGIKEISLNGAFTQPEFFKVFGFTLLHGNQALALTAPKSVVMSRAFAAKFFNEENPVGKTFTIGKLGSFQITGVMNEPAGKSHISYDVLVSYSSIEQLEKDNLMPKRSGNWDSFEYAYTYVLLNKAVSSENLDATLTRLSATLNKDVTTGSFAFKKQDMKEVALSFDLINNDVGYHGSWGKLISEAGIALIILFAACFNYTNLSLARALTRAKEVGIRKVAGAARWQVFAQYIIEAVVVSLMALCVAYVVFSFIMEFKPFNDDYEFMPDVTIDASIVLYFILFSLLAGLVAGSMPAWILSSFKPARILKGMAGVKITGNISLRKVLMVFQFSLSMIILVFLSTFYQQFAFMASADTGFEKSNILSIAHTGKGDVFRTELLKTSGIDMITSVSDNFGRHPTGRNDVTLSSDIQKRIQIDYYFADENTMDVMGLKLVAGKNFPASGQADEKLVLINETGAKALGFSNYKDAVGEQLLLRDSIEVVITGVYRDFYNEGVGNAIRPLLLRNNTYAAKLINVKVTASSAQTIVSRIEAVWKKIYPDRTFSYTWLDKQLQSHTDQTATVSLLGFLAFMTIVIAALGLLGLVVYTVETRRREISIRKVIGAEVHQLMTLLSRGFASLLLIAGVIAIPLGYILSQFFLMNFANRVSVGAGTLALSFGLLLAIGLLAILPQTYQAANENPTKNLGSE